MSESDADADIVEWGGFPSGTEVEAAEEDVSIVNGSADVESKRMFAEAFFVEVSSFVASLVVDEYGVDVGGADGEGLVTDFDARIAFGD